MVSPVSANLTTFLIVGECCCEGDDGTMVTVGYVRRKGDEEKIFFSPSKLDLFCYAVKYVPIPRSVHYNTISFSK